MPTTKATPGVIGIEHILPIGFISGLVTTNSVVDAANDVTVSAGICSASGGDADMLLAVAMTKQIDAAWSVGSDAGGLDTGTVAVDTSYYVWLIMRSDTGAVDVLLSLSSSNPTMPANYDYKRRVGAVLTNGTAALYGFETNEVSGGGVRVQSMGAMEAGQDVSTTTIVNGTEYPMTLSCPDMPCEVIMMAMLRGGGSSIAGMKFYNASGTPFTNYSYGNIMNADNTGNTLSSGKEVTLAIQGNDIFYKVETAATAATLLWINTVGWIDGRRD